MWLRQIEQMHRGNAKAIVRRSLSFDTAPAAAEKGVGGRTGVSCLSPRRLFSVRSSSQSSS